MLKFRFRSPLPVLLPALALACLQTSLHAQTTTPNSSQSLVTIPSFSQLIVFGDSLSDVGNDADNVDENYGFRFPGPTIAEEIGEPSLDYTDGRFTNGSDTDPAAMLYSGVWHEQLAKLFLGLPAATASRDGGFDYAGGGATTEDGQSTLSEGEGAASLSIQVDNMNRQVSTYLDSNATDPDALYIVWGGANDIFASANNAPSATTNETAIIQRLAEAGAKTFLVPNIPPLGYTPDYDTSDATRDAYNQVSSDFRNALNADLDALETTLANEGLTVKIYRLDVYELFMRLVANQYAYGFDNITDPSQGAKETDQHLFWDGVHPTTAGHFQLAAEAFTLLSGTPVVEINPTEDGNNFYLTRTGTDLSAKLSVMYTAGGSAVGGEDYTTLSGKKSIKAGSQTAVLHVKNTDDARAGTKVKVKLLPEPTYVLPVVTKGKIALP